MTTCQSGELRQDVVFPLQHLKKPYESWILLEHRGFMGAHSALH